MVVATPMDFAVAAIFPRRSGFEVYTGFLWLSTKL
jgi:hypothetical protein